MPTHAGIGTALAALVLTLTPLTAAAAPGDPRGQGADHRSDRAEATLAAAQEMFAAAARPWTEGWKRSGPGSGPDAEGDISGGTPDAPYPREATLLLRDLARSLDALGPADRRAARRILARPTDAAATDDLPGKYNGAAVADTCSLPGGDVLEVCVHWVTNPANRNAPRTVNNGNDKDGNGVPDWVDENQRVFEEVWDHIVDRFRYRAPRPDLPDLGHGPDDRTDIYLAELGAGAYGYCTTDPIRQRTAYCVIDNDFAGFPGAPGNNLRVTAAHEFFHAVQFAYNIDAPRWFMEGTAAWVEDEVYDDVNDNLQFLVRSPLFQPDVPLDFLSKNYQTDGSAYGSWIWWRFLTEYFGGTGPADPSVIRQVWERVAVPVPNEGPFRAMNRVFKRRGTTFGAAFSDFAAVNRIPRRWYDEGGSYVDFVAPPSRRLRMSSVRRDTGWLATRLRHLSTQHVLLLPDAGLTGRWRLRLSLDLPRRAAGSGATVMVHHRGGRISWIRVDLDADGDRRLTLPFEPAGVSHVALSLTNAGLRDQRTPFAFRARAVRPTR